MTNPLNLLALDEVRNKVKTDVEIAISTEKKIKKAIDQHYGAAARIIESTVQRMAEGNAGRAVPGVYRLQKDL